MGAYISPSRQERASRALAALRHARKTLHRFGWCSSRDVALSDGVRFTIVGALSTGPDQLGAWFARMLLHRVLPMGCTLDAFEASKHTDQADVEKARAEGGGRSSDQQGLWHPTGELVHEAWDQLEPRQAKGGAA